MALDCTWKRFEKILTFLAIFAAGCDNTGKTIDHVSNSSIPSGKLTSKTMTAGALVEKCIQRYQGLNSYEDSGKVRLRYSLDGKTVEDVAPLAIALQRPNRLGIKAYRVQAAPDADRWRMRIGEGSEAPIPQQVVSRNVPELLDLSWLSSDVVAGQYLSAGLGGFPPQLDLLLAQSPMRGLVDESAKISLMGTEIVSDSKCYVVSVFRGEIEYRLWIDQETMLLRLLEVPQANLPPTMLDDQRVSNIRLTIELEEARINQPIDWIKWQVPRADGEQLVNHFVEPPPSLPTSLLGKQIPAFMLSSSDDREILNSHKSASRPVTVLLWLADHPACRASASQFADVARRWAGDKAVKVKFVAVWAEPNPPADASFENLAARWNLPMDIAVDRQAIGRDLFGIREAPTLVVLDSHNRLQIQEERGNPMLGTLLPGILERLIAGENLAEGIVKVAKSDRERFDAELWMAAAVDANMSAFTRPRSYAPRAFRLQELDRQESTSDIMALAIDGSQGIWVLRSNGLLEQLDVHGKVDKKFEPKWNYAAHDQVNLLVDPEGKFAASCARDADRVELLDTSTEQQRTVRLNNRERIIDLMWLSGAELGGPQLALLLSDRRTLLVDPTNGQQLIGECPAEPLAVLPQRIGSDAANNIVVLSDRRVEPLVLMKPTSTGQLAKPASHATASDLATNTSTSLARLLFQPGSGPWSISNGSQSTAILARGWFAANEPAMYLLDAQLRQQWHYRMPLARGDSAWPLASVARDPVSGQPTFVVVGPSQTIHLLRADGQLSDHFQLDQPVRGIAALASGDHLQLLIAHPRQLVRYGITFVSP